MSWLWGSGGALRLCILVHFQYVLCVPNYRELYTISLIGVRNDIDSKPVYCADENLFIVYITSEREHFTKL